MILKFYLDKSVKMCYIIIVTEDNMKELFYTIVGIVIGGLFHDDIPYIKDLNSRKIKRHLTGLVEAVSEAK